MAYKFRVREIFLLFGASKNGATYNPKICSEYGKRYSILPKTQMPAGAGICVYKVVCRRLSVVLSYFTAA